MPNVHVTMCLFCVIKHVKCLKPSAGLFTLVSMDVVFSTSDLTAQLVKPQLFQDSIKKNLLSRVGSY